MLPSRYRGKILFFTYVAVAATYVAFFWGFKYVPTQDGPVHLSTAVVLKSLLAGDSLYTDYYELNLTPAPYWAYHGVTVPLLAAFRPLVAEKIFLSLYVIAFAAAAWYFTKAVAGRASALGLLFLVAATSYPFQMGFFNFMVGLPAFLLTTAFFWSRRERADWRFWAVLNLLVAACYFTHFIAAGAAIISIWVMSLWLAATAPGGRRFLRGPLYLAPSYILPAYYLITTPKGREYDYNPLGLLARELFSSRVFVSFGPAQEAVAWAVTALVLLLLAAAIAGRLRGSGRRLRPSDSFAALAGVFVVIYFAAPCTTPPGVFCISERMALFLFLLITPWLALNVPRLLMRPAAGVAVALAVANLIPLGRYYAAENAKLKVFNSGCCVVARGGALLPLIKERRARSWRIEVLRNAVAYYVVSNGGCNLIDFGANMPHFPIKYAPGVESPPSLGKFAGLRVYDVEAERPAADYVFAYDMNPFLAEVRPLLERYRPVHFKDKLIIFERVAGRAGEGATPRAGD